MSSIRALQRLGGTSAGGVIPSEEEKKTYHTKAPPPKKIELPEKPSRGGEPRKPRTANPLEKPSRVINMVRNEIQWGTKQAGNALGNVIRQAAGLVPVTVEQAEKAAQFRKSTGKQKVPDRIDQLVGEPVRAATRAIGGAPVRAAEGVVGTAFFAGDLINTGIDRLQGKKTDPSLNPFHLNYVEPQLNTGIAVPQSSAGKLVQGIVQFAGSAASIGSRLPQATTKLGAFARGEAGGIAADLLMTRKGDGNLSALIRDVFPEEWQDSVLFFLASDEEDSAVTSRLKAATEGAGLGAAFGLLGAIRKARKADLPAEIDGQKPTPEQELEFRAQIYQDYLNEAAKTYGDAAVKEAQRFDEINLRLLDEAEFNQLELDLGDVPGSGRLEVDPGGPREQQLSLADTLPPREPDVDLGAAQRGPSEVDAGPSMRVDGPTGPQRLPVAEGTPKPDTPKPDTADQAEAKPEAPWPKPLVDVVADKGDDWATRRGLDPDAIRAAYQSKIDLGYTPQDFSLLPQERAYSFTPDTPDVALRSTYPTKVFTDAQVKSWRWEDKLEEAFRDFEQDPKVQEILTSEPTLQDKQVIADHYKAMNDILESIGETEFFRVPDINKRFDEQGLIQVVKRNGVETPIFTETGVLAARTYFRDLGNHAWTIAKQMADLDEAGQPFGNLPDKMLDDLLAMMNVGKRTMQMGGRLTRAWGINISNTTGTMSLGKDIDGSNGFDEAISQIQALQEAIAAGQRGKARDTLSILGAMLRTSQGKPEKIMNFWQLVRTVGIKEAGTMMINSLFSAPITQARNITGNSYTVVERPASALINSVMARDPNTARMAIAGLRATAQAIPEALQMSFTALRDGNKALRYGDGAKYIQLDANTNNALQELLARAKTPSEKAAANYLNLQHKMVTANPLFDYGTRLLTAADEAFSHLALRQWAAMESMYKAASESGNTREAFQRYTKEFYETKIGADGQIIDPDLKDWVRDMTFQGPVADKVQALSTFLNQVPVLKWFVPVVNTPAEILRYVGTHIPGVNKVFLRDYAEIVERAKVDPAARAKKAVYDGRVGLGMMIAGAGAVYAFGDFNVTGHGPPRGTREYDMWKNLNRQPMQFRVGGTWYDYSSIEPLASILAPIADAAMLSRMGAADAGHRVMAQVAFTIAATVLDKTVLTGLKELTEVLDTRTGADQRAAAFLTLANNTLPLSSARRSLYNTFNQHRKEYQTLTDKIWAQATVGLMDKGSVAVDPLTGEGELSYAGGFYNSNSPIRVVQEDMDPLKWQLEKDGFGYRPNKMGPNQVKLTPEDMQKVHRYMFELGIREVMAETVTDPAYRELADSWDRRPYDQDQPGGAPPHINILRRNWNLVRNNAIERLMDEDAGFFERMKEGGQLKQMYRDAAFEDIGAPAPTVMNKLLQAPK